MSRPEQPHADHDRGECTTAVHRVIDDPLTDPTPPRVASVAGAVLGSGALEVVRGPIAGAQFLLSNPATAAGRHPDAGVFLDDITVSRRHAEFRWLDGEYWVIDTGSLNGTYVNRVGVESLPLSSGDEIQIGTFRLRFTCQPPPPR